jgi:hypothetical protein
MRAEGTDSRAWPESTEETEEHNEVIGILSWWAAEPRAAGTKIRAATAPFSAPVQMTRAQLRHSAAPPNYNPNQLSGLY